MDSITEECSPAGLSRRNDRYEEWCAKGAAVTFRTNDLPPIFSGATIPNHFGPEIIDGFGPDNAITYLLDRLADKPVAGCAIDRSGNSVWVCSDSAEAVDQSTCLPSVDNESSLRVIR